MDNYINKCAICGKPILGYWYALGKNNICQSCGASVTVYDLFMRDLVDIKPDIIDSDATLVTKDSDSPKQVISSKYGMISEAALVTMDDGYHYTNKDIATARKIIDEIKSRGFMSEREFFDECQTLWDAGASDTDNSLLILLKQYEDIMPTPRYEGDEGNDTWDAMYALWQ